MLKGGYMSLNNNQFKVRWIDQDKKEHVKIYTNYLEADKAYRWLVKNGAEAPDIAIITKPVTEPAE